MPSPRLALTVLALTLACKPGPGTGDGDTGAAETSAAETDGVTSVTTGAGPASTTAASATGTASATDGEPTTTDIATSEPGTTDQPGECAALQTQKECASNPACQPVLGTAQQFDGCAPGKHFLACIDAMPCDAVLLTVCRDGTAESYQLADGCVPPGFTPCDGPGAACVDGDDFCESLKDPAECTIKQCRVVFGAPHIVVDDMVCASYGDDEQFLGCIGLDAACADDIIVICPTGQDDPSFDSASGCIPPGFTDCDAPPVPPCS